MLVIFMNLEFVYDFLLFFCFLLFQIKMTINNNWDWEGSLSIILSIYLSIYRVSLNPGLISYFYLFEPSGKSVSVVSLSHSLFQVYLCLSISLALPVFLFSPPFSRGSLLFVILFYPEIFTIC